MAEQSAGVSFAFQIDSRFELAAQGWWERGGAVQVSYDGDPIDGIYLAPGPFAVLAQLMLAAQRSAEFKKSALAFVSAKKLADLLLQDTGLGDNDPQNIHRQVYKLRDQLSVIGSLSLSPRRGRIGVAFAIHRDNIRAPQAIDYLRGLHRQLRRPLIVVMDRLNVHCSAVRQLREAGATWLEVEWLPSYAPDLNPVEAIWPRQVLHAGQLRPR